MNIAVIGTRGIPNHYGGFEQFAEFLSKALASKGHNITVYNSHNHPFQGSEWNKVTISHQYDPEYILGTAGQFIYDLNCILDSRGKNFDIILQLGYTSSSIWSFLFPKKSTVVTNMDGLEWKRTKYSSWIKKFLKYAEYLGAQKSDYLVADSVGIQEHLMREYHKVSEYIPYGANLFSDPNENVLSKFNLKKFEYDILIARMEPENNIEVILDGVVKADTGRDFIVIGGTTTPFGKKLTAKFRDVSSIKFVGALYDLNALNNLRYFSNLYFHGHSVGGTNPSLLEAMASHALICAHRNVFNQSILDENAYYFENEMEVSDVLKSVRKGPSQELRLAGNVRKINEVYNWQTIIDQYEKLFIRVLSDQGAND